MIGLRLTRPLLTQSQLMLVTKAIPETPAPKAGAGEVCGVFTTNKNIFWKK